MTKDQIQHEMKVRIEMVRVAAECALWEIEHGNFSQILLEHLEEMKMYSERARLDWDASYLVA